MELFSIFAAFVVCVICFVAALVLLTLPEQPPERLHHHSLGVSRNSVTLGCGFLLLAAGVIAFLLVLAGLFGGD